MKDTEIFLDFVFGRDYSNIEDDLYRQMLGTLLVQMPEVVTVFMRAHEEGKKISIKKESLHNDEITMEDVVIT